MGTMLRTIREALDLTIGDVAGRTGIAKSSLSAYETGKRELSNSRYRAVVGCFASEMLARTEGAR